MRKIVVYELLSLDGVAAAPDSYAEWAQFWPSSDIEPFATFINGFTSEISPTGYLLVDYRVTP